MKSAAPDFIGRLVRRALAPAAIAPRVLSRFELPPLPPFAPPEPTATDEATESQTAVFPATRVPAPMEQEVMQRPARERSPEAALHPPAPTRAEPRVSTDALPALVAHIRHVPTLRTPADEVAVSAKPQVTDVHSRGATPIVPATPTPVRVADVPPAVPANGAAQPTRESIRIREEVLTRLVSERSIAQSTASMSATAVGVATAHAAPALQTTSMSHPGIPPIEITIGRIEISSIVTDEAPRKRPDNATERGPALPLADYLKLRGNQRK